MPDTDQRHKDTDIQAAIDTIREIGRKGIYCTYGEEHARLEGAAEFLAGEISQMKEITELKHTNEVKDGRIAHLVKTAKAQIATLEGLRRRLSFAQSDMNTSTLTHEELRMDERKGERRSDPKYQIAKTGRRSQYGTVGGRRDVPFGRRSRGNDRRKT